MAESGQGLRARGFAKRGGSGPLSDSGVAEKAGRSEVSLEWGGQCRASSSSKRLELPGGSSVLGSLFLRAS